MQGTQSTGANGIQKPYIERRPEVSQGKPVIAGTRIKVGQIALEYERLGWTPDQIIDAHPHLTLVQVHAALAYYYEHQAEIDVELANAQKLVAELRRRYPSKVASMYSNLSDKNRDFAIR
ncbi:MAG: DUF433 domain-containing protein [Litorilinea sp.]